MRQWLRQVLTSVSTLFAVVGCAKANTSTPQPTPTPVVQVQPTQTALCAKFSDTTTVTLPAGSGTIANYKFAYCVSQGVINVPPPTPDKVNCNPGEVKIIVAVSDVPTCPQDMTL